MTQRNVTLGTETKQAEELRGKPFGCPLCGMTLPLEISQKQKPYCTCNDCGIQLFFRGKTGIKRLQRLLEEKEPISVEITGASFAVSIYNRLEQLKQQREELENKQGIIFRDQDLDNAIAAMDREIKRLQSDLEKSKKDAEKKKWNMQSYMREFPAGIRSGKDIRFRRN